MTTKTLASSLAALALFAVQGAVEPVWTPAVRLDNPTIVNAVGFENYALGSTLTNTYDDAGLANSSQAYFLYQGTSGDDNSIVTNYENGATIPEDIPFYFQRLDSNKYLSLSTEGGTLFRSLNVINTEGETPALGTAEEIQESGLFVDTLVQFTPCEEAPSVESGNKLAIWLGVETNGLGEAIATNLCVKAGYLTYEDSTYGRTSATYTLANTSVISIEAGEWVRLTVKAIRNIYSNTGLTGQPAFQVFINDELAVFNENVGSADYMTQLATDDADAKTALEANTILPSMQDDAYLQAVGFQGTGAVDDFVVTTQKPGFLAVDFTLFWDSNILALDAYLNDSEDPVDFTGADLSKVFEGLGDGDTLEIELPAAGTSTSVAEGYEIDWENTVLTNATMEPLTYQGNVYAYLFTLDGDGPYSVTLVTKSATPAGPFGGGSGTELDPYIISSADHLTELATGVAGGDTYSGKFFQMSGDIDMASAGAWDGIGVYNDSTKCFAGTFDGNGYMITNLLFAAAKYRGFFDQLEGTVKNLTIDVAGFEDTQAAEHGYAAFAGNMKNAKLINCVATGMIGTIAKPAMHTCGGLAVKVTANSMFENCTNFVDIVCGLDDNPKIGGIVGLATGAAITNCWNYGDMMITLDDCPNNANGAGGFIGYSQTTACTISGGGNAGTIAKGSVVSQASGTKYPVHLGTIIAYAGSVVTVSDGTVAQADALPAEMGTLNGATYATVSGNVATFVADADLVKDTQYKAMRPVASGTVFTLEAVGDWISFDTNLVSFAGEVAVANVGMMVETTEANGVVKFEAKVFGAPKTVEPGSATELDAATAEAATNEAESVTIVIADSAAAAAGQAAVLKKVITYDEGTGKYSVELAIDEDAAAFVDPDEAVAVVAGVLSGSAASVTVPADKLTPGLYYSLAVATDVDGTYNEGTRYLADGSNEGLLLPITKPEGTKAFYKVLVNMTGTPTPPPNAGE
jgi:hypothetical protein